MITLIFSLILLLAGCSCGHEDEEGGITRKDLILITDSQVTNFISVLPYLLEFSEKYHQSLSKQEKEREDANKRFFETLKKSKKIQSIVHEHGFKSIDELIAVYKNVVLGYMSIKVELKDFEKDFSKLSSIILSNESKLKNDFESKKIKKEEFEIRSRDIELDKIRLQNILVIKKYEREIDEVISKYNTQ